jgi:hypothetical protein
MHYDGDGRVRIQKRAIVADFVRAYMGEKWRWQRLGGMEI